MVEYIPNNIASLNWYLHCHTFKLPQRRQIKWVSNPRRLALWA